jgi:hypothetical protein
MHLGRGLMHQRARIRWIARIGQDGTALHRFGSQTDLRGFERCVRGWLETIPRSIIAVPMHLRPFANALLDILRAEVRRQEAVGEDPR